MSIRFLRTDIPIDSTREPGNARFFGGPRHGDSDFIINYSYDTSQFDDINTEFPAEVYFQAPIQIDGQGSWITSPAITYKLWRSNRKQAVYVFDGWFEALRDQALKAYIDDFINKQMIAIERRLFDDNR